MNIQMAKKWPEMVVTLSFTFHFRSDYIIAAGKYDQLAQFSNLYIQKSTTIDSGINIGLRLLIFEKLRRKRNQKMTTMPRFM